MKIEFIVYAVRSDQAVQISAGTISGEAHQRTEIDLVPAARPDDGLRLQMKGETVQLSYEGAPRHEPGQLFTLELPAYPAPE